MALDPAANFVRGSTDASIDNSATTLSVADASIFTDPSSEGEYNIVVWAVDSFPRPDQDPDVEVMRVTARDTGADELTVTRGQEGTAAASHPSGSAVQMSATAKVFDDIATKTSGLSDDGTSLSIEGVNNIHILPEVDGSTLNAKWDNLTSGWTDGETHAVFIPPVDQDNDGGRDDTVTLGNGIVCWDMDGAITIDNDRDNVVINAFRSNISHDSANSFTNFIEIIDGSNKPENVDIHGGLWRCNGGVTNLIQTTGGSRIRLYSVKGGATSNGNFDRGVYAVSDDHEIGEIVVDEMQGSVFDEATIEIDGTANQASNSKVSQVRGSGNQDVVLVRGDTFDITAEGVSQTATNTPTRSGVRLEATSNGRPDNCRVEDVSVFSSGVVAMSTGDTTGGTQSRLREISCENLSVGNGETVASLDWIQGCPDLDIGGTDLSWTIDVGVNSNAFDCGVKFGGSDVTLNRGANAARIVSNGTGINAGNPVNTGQWNGNGYEGLVVRDTTNNTTYVHIGGGFVAV